MTKKKAPPKPVKKAVKKKPTKATPPPLGRPREWDEERIGAETKALIAWSSNPKNVYFTNFLVERDLDTAHLDRFAKYSEPFRLALEKAKKIQECRLVDLAIFRKGDAGFIKFVLQNKSGWKEKSELSGNAQNPLAIILDNIAANAKDPLEYDAE